MAHAKILGRDSLAHFASVPHIDSSCETCKKATDTKWFPIDLQSLSESSNCPQCRIRYLGVLRAIGRYDPNTKVDLSFEGPLIRIQEDRGSGRGEYYNPDVLVYLHTKSGQAKSSWPTVGVGRDVGPRRTSFAAIVEEWLRICHENHPRCPKDRKVKLPTRVLDVGSATSDLVKLRNVSGQKGSYLALSHCWGGKIEIRTTWQNIHAREAGVNFTDLPKNFQDAVTVTRSLGLKYLWIDALCIIQDDKLDWEKESGNMAAVYENALMVLGADMSADSHGGFLDVERAGYSSWEAPVAIVDSENTTIYARSQLGLHWNPCPMFQRVISPCTDDREPLSQRAWALQEQFLASRMVHFAKRELIWQCNSALSCECMELDRGISAENERVPYHESLISDSTDKFRIWYRIVDAIGSRDITKPTDILPALSGLARQFQDNGAGRYLAGLWLDDLPQGLLWDVENRWASSRASPYRAPSWSWASILDGKGSYNHMGGETDFEAKLEPVYAKILDAACCSEGEDCLGAVSSGYLIILAPLMEMGQMYRVSDRPSIFGVSMDVETEPVEGEILYCLFIGELTVGASGAPSRGLVLQQQRDLSIPIFERVGSFFGSRGAFQKFTQVVKERVIVVI